jgi:hypothetical protein
MKTWKAVTAVFAAAAGLWLWLRFLMWEPSDVEQGSMAYWLKVPSEIRSLQLWHVLGSPRYDVRVGDGPVPAYVRIRYHARGALSSLHEAVVSDGFACTESERTELLCERQRGDEHDQLYARYDWQSDVIAVRTELVLLVDRARPRR